MRTLHYPRHQMIPPRSMIPLRLRTRLQDSEWLNFVASIRVGVRIVSYPVLPPRTRGRCIGSAILPCGYRAPRRTGTLSGIYGSSAGVAADRAFVVHKPCNERGREN